MIDDGIVRKVLQAILKDEGYTDKTAERAKKGIETSKEAFCNLALIDVRLPDMEGIEFIKTAQCEAEMRKITVTSYLTL
jgi:DNA-binding NtrC family response regulator